MRGTRRERSGSSTAGAPAESVRSVGRSLSGMTGGRGVGRMAAAPGLAPPLVFRGAPTTNPQEEQATDVLRPKGPSAREGSPLVRRLPQSQRPHRIAAARLGPRAPRRDAVHRDPPDL